jgi:hypothetical protein
MANLFQKTKPSRSRIALALTIAIIADGLQLLLGPLGWVFVDEAIDLAVMFLLTLLIGFHPLFLPTFVVEFIPVADMLPTWTGCVAIVAASRRKQQEPTPPVSTHGVIDI